MSGKHELYNRSGEAVDSEAAVQTVHDFFHGAINLLGAVTEKRHEQDNAFIRDLELPAEDLLMQVTSQDAMMTGLNSGKPTAVRFIHQHNLGGYDSLVNVIISSEDMRTQIIIMDDSDFDDPEDIGYEGFIIREQNDRPPFITVPTETEVQAFTHLIDAAGYVTLPS